MAARNRLPPENTIPFDGTDYIADAGLPREPNPDFLQGRPRATTSASPTRTRRTKDGDGVEVFNKPQWKDGKLAGEGYFVNHIPAGGHRRGPAGGKPLIKRGQQQFNVHCAICHGDERPRRRRRDRASASSARMGCPSRRRTS